MSDITYIYFDTETTGLSSEKNQLLSIAMLNGKTDESIELYLDHKEYFFGAWALNNFRQFAEVYMAEKKGAYLLNAKVKQFVDAAKADGSTVVLVAHNAKFDLGFLEAGINYTPDVPVVCTYDVVNELKRRGKIPKSQSRSQQDMLKFYDPDYEDTGSHNALYDAETLKILHERMLQDLEVE